MVQLGDFLLNFGYNLDATAASTDDSDSLALKIISLFISCGVHEFALERLEAYDVGPFVIVEHTSSIDEVLSGVF